MLVYVNAGHGKGTRGQYDPGAVGPTGLREAEVTQDLADRVEHLLRAKGIATDGKKVESLYEAVRAANTAGAAVFVSIHCNSLRGSPARGTETWYHGSKGQALARAVHTRMIERLATDGGWKEAVPVKDRGLKYGTFYVLKGTRMPSILVEVAFISHPDEEALLKDRHYRQEVAQAIADGVAAYLGKE